MRISFILQIQLYNRICKIKKDYKLRIEFLKNMCQHYTDNLSHRINAFAFDEIEVRQKLNKLEWDLIFLQVITFSYKRRNVFLITFAKFGSILDIKKF